MGLARRRTVTVTVLDREHIGFAHGPAYHGSEAYPCAGAVGGMPFTLEIISVALIETPREPQADAACRNITWRPTFRRLRDQDGQYGRPASVKAHLVLKRERGRS